MRKYIKRSTCPSEVKLCTLYWSTRYLLIEFVAQMCVHLWWVLFVARWYFWDGLCIIPQCTISLVYSGIPWHSISPEGDRLFLCQLQQSCLNGVFFCLLCLVLHCAYLIKRLRGECRNYTVGSKPEYDEESFKGRGVARIFLMCCFPSFEIREVRIVFFFCCMLGVVVPLVLPSALLRA